jgi:predicted SprT family Zn-dependent metalloprotease
MNTPIIQAPKVIFSTELQARVNSKIEAGLVIAKEKYPKFNFEFPEVRYDVKNSIGGLAYGNKWMIRFNLILCYENEDEFVNTTVLHELAHLIQRRVFGFIKADAFGNPIRDEKTGKLKKVLSHGKEWAEVMGHFGLKPEKFHTFSLESIQKPKRSKRGSMLSANDVNSMFRRLENGIKRLPPEAKLTFQSWLSTHITDDSFGDEA